MLVRNLCLLSLIRTRWVCIQARDLLVRKFLLSTDPAFLEIKKLQSFLVKMVLPKLAKWKAGFDLDVLLREPFPFRKAVFSCFSSLLAKMLITCTVSVNLLKFEFGFLLASANYSVGRPHQENKMIVTIDKCCVFARELNFCKELTHELKCSIQLQFASDIRHKCASISVKLTSSKEQSKVIKVEDFFGNTDNL